MKKNPYAKVKRGLLVDCLTCPLCSNLLREATTICVCLHTFCKECIYQTFEDDETYCCPICNVYLGCLPQEKLRPDNNLQELRMKIFPIKKSKEPDGTSSQQTMSSRRKKKLLSSLVIDTKPMSKRLEMGRAKALRKKAGMSGVSVSKPQAGRDANKGNDNPEWIHSPKRSKKPSMASKKQRILGEEEPFHISSSVKRSPHHIETSEKKEDRSPNWEWLAFLAEAAERTEDSNMPTLALPAYKMEENNNTNMKTIKKFKRKPRQSTHGSMTSVRSKEARKFLHRNMTDETLTSSSNGSVKALDIEKHVATAAENVFSDKSHKRLHPIWLSLLASEDLSEDSYPQIPKRYIRIKDGTIPVSYIKRYLVQKLDLRDESEIEVMCCGQTLVSSTTLNNLVDIWVKSAGLSLSHLKHDPKDSENHNFVMVLTYKKSK